MNDDRPSGFFCIVPWMHTNLRPDGNRQLCCVSWEERTHSFAKEFMSLDDHWNGDFIKSIRKQILQNKIPPECAGCKSAGLKVHSYNRYFDHDKFSDIKENILKSTDNDGHTSLKPCSFDYRLTNKCNFMCRTCTGRFSSRWEQDMSTEKFEPMRNNERTIAEQELLHALQNGQIREIYWAGGEPLVDEFHWTFMKKAAESNFAENIYCRYNTNLSVIKHKEIHLLEDILTRVNGFHIGASIDAAGKIGEYIRAGLNWNSWKENLTLINSYCRTQENKYITMNVTLSTPALLGMKGLIDLANEQEITIYVQMVEDNGNLTYLLSPCVLPTKILIPIVDDLIQYISKNRTPYTQNLYSLLEQLISSKIHEEQETLVPSEIFQQNRKKILDYEKKNNDRYTLSDIYSANSELFRWWNQ